MKKFLSLAVLLAAVVLGANSAAAQSTGTLQSEIDRLMDQLAALQGSTSTTSTSCYAFTRDLTVGSQGADVTALQAYLATSNHFKVAPTGYFGPITAQALASWQAANGVSPAAGYFGPISRAKYNMLCGVTTTTTTTTTTSTGTSSSNDDDDFDFGDGEEASLEDFDAQDGDDTDLAEGSSEQQVLEFEFDVEDSSVRVERVQVTFDGTGNTEDEPWEVFQGAQLWYDGDMVGEVEDLDDEDEWDEETGDTYSFRFNGVDVVVDEGDKAMFIVSVDTQDNLDEFESWEIFIGDNEEGVRALDEAGIDQYIGDENDTVTVDLEEAGEDDELKLTESDDNEDAMTLEVDEDDKSDWQTIARMNLAADMDIELKDFIFQILINEGVSPADEVYNDVISDLVLVIDGQEYDDFSISGGTTATATVTFDLDDEDAIIEDGDDVEVEVMAEFKSLTSNYDEGTTVTVNASSGLFETIDAEGVDSGEDLGAAQLEGSFEGETHTLRSEGFSVAFVDQEAVSPVGSTESRADYWIEFTVTAFGDDFFVPKTTLRDDAASTTVGATYMIENSSGNEYTSGTTSAALTSSSRSGDTSSYYKVSEGQTRTFKLDVSLDNLGATTGFYGLQLISVAFDTDTVAGGENVVGEEELEDFDTDVENVQNANVD